MMRREEFATSDAGVRHAGRFRRQLLFVALLSTSIAFAAACSSDTPSTADSRAIAIYAAAIRAASSQPIGNPPTISRLGQIFVVGARTEIPISVQAGIAEALEKLATIRFVDSKSEALDKTTPHDAVHGNGILITLGDIPPGLDDVTLIAQRYERTDRTATFTIRLHRIGATWNPVSTTST